MAVLSSTMCCKVTIINQIFDKIVGLAAGNAKGVLHVLSCEGFLAGKGRKQGGVIFG